MTKADLYFKDLCTRIINEGTSTDGEKVRPVYKDNTPSHTLFVTQVFEEYDISKGEFPLITYRPISWKSAVKEILWIYQDQTSSLNVLKGKYDIHWWDEWNIGDGTIGQRYGATVKKYDLVNKLLKSLKEIPYGRRHIINLYQYEDFLETDGLYPCAMETHWSVRGDFLDVTLIQRSSDVAVANCINKIQYTALLMMVARHVGLSPGKLCHYVHNAHIYDRHIDDVISLLKRDVGKEISHPSLILNSQKTDFYNFTINDFDLIDYNPIKPNPKFELAI